MRFAAITIPLALLVACASLDPPAPADTYVAAGFSKPSRGSTIVVLPPQAQFPEFADGQDVVEEELIRSLVEAGYKVQRVVRKEFTAAWKEEVLAVGGLFDAATGQRIAGRYEEALGKLTRRIVNDPATLVLGSRLVLRSAPLFGASAQWDGQTRSLRTTGDAGTPVIWSGTTKGLSLELTAIASDGRRLFKTYGGLALPYRTSVDRSEMELRSDTFARRGEISAGTAVALRPLLAGLTSL
jgi:hypothetical protein